IAQEALNNARRHAQAEYIHAEIEYGSGGVTLKVTDNGRGFEMPAHLNQLTRSGHFGLIGMRERAQLVAGQLAIKSVPGEGTVLTFSIPAT
ncbi:MAG: hypothetical protein K8J31_31500, partial [Anaerolineae bacterium]|nr:hypothetical protein [Anaerolineae bacterium]